VFEQDTTDMLGGYQAGVANAHRAVGGAVWCGYRGLIFMACDTHLSPEQIPTALAYLDGAASVLGADLTGCYGFPELISAARAGGHARGFWQCGNDPGPLGDAHLWQVNTGSVSVAGVACDVNVQYAPIPAPGSTPAPVSSRHRLEDPVAPIPISVQPDGTFRATLMCESGGGSQVVAQAWLDIGSTWGASGFRVTALSPAAITCLYPAG
ncbi:hypothetical protein, partial [Streptosporangium nondiastaticum]|uniref:hypothetical protein n=1 Tax=Streptosporangium nondiastaticum TaxID=35764 RepID=UPI003F4AB548